ncbi:MAG: response regulator transcription factor [Pseudomonadota bacterium]
METILLVEDDEATRNWLAALLADMSAGQAPACCSTAGEALHWMQHHTPDIVLCDLGLPDRPGTDVIRDAATRHPSCDILVITVFGDEQHVVAAMEAGASGYLLKDASLANMREHLDYLRLGGSPMSPRIARLLIRQYRPSRLPGDEKAVGLAVHATPVALPTDDPKDTLSARETEVLTGIAKGFTYAEVAGALDVSGNTVRTHIKRIYQKLAVNSRSEAVWEYNQRATQQGRPPLA